MDSGDKSSNKAMSAAYKYACFLAFAIPTEGDNDADSHTHEVAAPKGKPMTPETEKALRFLAGAEKSRQLVDRVMLKKGLLQLTDFDDKTAINTIQWVEAELKKETK